MGLGFQHASTIFVFMHKCIHYCCFKLPAPSTESLLCAFELNELLEAYTKICVDIYFIVNKSVNEALSYFYIVEIYKRGFLNVKKSEN